MMKRWIIAVGIGVICLVLATPTYLVKANPVMPRIFCNQHSCLIFINQQYDGWKVRYFEFPFGLIRALLGGGNPPSNIAHVMFVVRADNTGVNHYSFRKDLAPGEIYDDQVIAEGEGGSWKWADTHFEKLVDDEERRYGDATRRGDILYGEFSGRRGWSASTLGLGKTVSADLDHNHIVITMNSDSHHTQRIMVQDTSGKLHDTVWSGDETLRRVDRSEYDKMFQK